MPLAHIEDVVNDQVNDTLNQRDGTMELAEKILNRLNISKPQRKFLLTLLTTILVARGRINFRNLSRYSDLCEHTYSRQFSQAFDFVDFNRHLINKTFTSKGERIWVFDASFVKKSGHYTFGLDRFWHGGHNRVEKGLEISTLAVADLSQNQALTLSVRQTPAQQDAQADDASTEDEEESRITHYVDHILQSCPYRAGGEDYLAVDGYFAKVKFIDPICGAGLHLIGRLRTDANMRYLYDGPKRPGRGRQRVYDGKVDWDDTSRMRYVGTKNGVSLFTAVLNHIHFKRNLRVLLLISQHASGTPRRVILFSTDIDLDAWKIYHYYRSRFQIEFIFRDAKQFTGLADCQARDEDRLDFHFNASLTALNVAKAEILNAQDAGIRPRCSLASIKAEYFNRHYLERIIRIFDLDLSWIKNHPQYRILTTYGNIAA